MRQIHSGSRLSPAFTREEQAAWQRLLPLGERKVWPPRAEIFSPSSQANGIHYIVRGNLRTLAISESGMQRLLWRMEPHSVFGEISLLTGKPCIHFIGTRTESETCYFSRALLVERIIPGEPVAALSLMRVLAEKIQLQSADIQAKTFLPARKLLARFLLDKASCCHEAPCLIRIHHAELAELLGIHRVTVTKALSGMRKEGLLDCVREGILIHRLDCLKQAARG